MCGRPSVRVSRNVSFAAFLLQLVMFVACMVSRMWAYYEPIYPVFGDRLTIGIWQGCVYYGDDNECEYLEPSGEAVLFVAQIMMGTAGLCQIPALVLYCLWLSKDQQYLLKFGAGKVGVAAMSLCIVSAFLSAAAIGYWGAEFGGGGELLHWGFYMACACALMNILNSSSTLAHTHCCRQQHHAPDNQSTSVSVEMPDGVAGTRSGALKVCLYPSLEGMGATVQQTETNVYSELQPSTYTELQPSAPTMYTQQQPSAYMELQPSAYTGQQPSAPTIDLAGDVMYTEHL